MHKTFFPLVALFWLTTWQHLAVAQQALPVNQGERVTLTLKLINVGDTHLRHVKVQLDPQTTPAWIQPQAGTPQAVNVPAKSAGEEQPPVMLPLTFTVDGQAPLEDEVSIRLWIGDGQGRVWTQMILLKVLPHSKPTASQVFQNYPNPFNPETWIPYQLSQPDQVKIRIYESSGRLVRTLDLGHQRAGFYTSRSEAAYWDGRNETGERVSSGLYFYQLQTDHFSAMRRMVIMK
ncbi:T9SS type A sorting domain-containing protein [Candidatus Poribacteria bacterium]|nr:T9SS type A sorting domain-containing protein [Candidatus Poribacteria bacterium]